jgi:uncharacterized protein
MDEREIIQKKLEEIDSLRDRAITEGGFGLHYAAETGNISLARIKLELEKVDINHKDETGYTPLIKAVMKGHVAFITFILEEGADPDAQTDEGFTALMAASESGETVILKLLLDHKADPNIKNFRGATSLHIAASLGNTEIIKILIESEADATIRDNTSQKSFIEIESSREVTTKTGDENIISGLTALDIAQICGHHDMIKILSE